MTGTRKSPAKSSKPKAPQKGIAKLYYPPMPEDLRRLSDTVAELDEDDIIIVNEFGEDESARHWAARHRVDLATRQERYGKD